MNYRKYRMMIKEAVERLNNKGEVLTVGDFACISKGWL